MYKERLARLVKVLGKGYKEIVGPFQITNKIKIDSIELWDDLLIFNIWVETLEFSLYYEDIKEEHIIILINILEEILING